MSDNSPSTASGGQNESKAAQPNQKEQNSVRQLILLLLLLLVASAYGYDRKIAGPGCERGQMIVLELLQEQQSQPGKVTASFAEVQQALARKPSSRVDEKYYAIETYSWRRGSVFQTYFIRVIYRKDKDGTFSVDGVTSPNEEPTEAQLPGPIKPREPTEEERAAMQSSPPTSSGPGGVIPPSAPGKQPPTTSEEPQQQPAPSESNSAEKSDPPPAQ